MKPKSCYKKQKEDAEIKLKHTNLLIVINLSGICLYVMVVVLQKTVANPGYNLTRFTISIKKKIIFVKWVKLRIEHRL